MVLWIGRTEEATEEEMQEMEINYSSEVAVFVANVAYGSVRNPVPVRQAEAEGKSAGRQAKKKAREDTGSCHGPSEGTTKPTRDRKPNPKYIGSRCSWVT